MDDYLGQAVRKKELDDKFSSFKSAAKQNEDLNKEHRNTLAKFYDNIALYSAGAISFSTTIVGLVLANYPKQLSQIVLFIPNIYYLYFCWLSFATAFVSALLYKKFDAYYISAFGMAHYTEKYHDYEKVILETIQTDEDALFTGGATQKDQVKVHTENVEKLGRAHHNNEKHQKAYWKAVLICIYTAQIGASVGLIFLLVFSVLLTQSVVAVVK